VAEPRTADVVVDVLVDAPAKAVWDTVVDWDRQREWMLGTRLRVVGDRREGLGTRLEAFTGVGSRVGFTDEMVVVEWEPPSRCVVRHTGRLVRGTGVFEVFALPEGRSRFVWSEHLQLPLGAVGRAGWPLVRPAVAAGVKASLRRLARRVAAYPQA
jgi:uncharacterized protein YndB with AHSA1/START domain